MQSFTVFQKTYEIAEAEVRRLHSGIEGLEPLLANFRTRIQTPTASPLGNRNLFVDPLHDSQRIGVPTQTVETVAAELNRLSVMNIWARVTCPYEDTEVITETDDESQFARDLMDCPHCGQDHSDIGWDSIQMLYAFNIAERICRHDLSMFFRTPEPLPGPKQVARTNQFYAIAKWVQRGPLSRFFTAIHKSLLPRSRHH